MKKMNDQEQEFSNAFNGKEAAPMEAPIDAPADAPMGAQAMEGATTDTEAAPPMEEPKVEEMAEPIATDAMAEDATEPAVAADEGMEVPAEESVSMEEDKSPEDIQREKSWEGRLRKREEELAARESGMTAEGQKGGASEALSKLSEQFGPEFADLVVQVIKEVAGEPKGTGDMDSLREEVGEVISDLKFAMHKRDILAAKADAYEIGETPEFQSWCSSQDDAEECKRIVEGGTSTEVIELMTRYEESLKDGGDSMDSATAVRGSAPINLPNKPGANADDEYSAAWNAL